MPPLPVVLLVTDLYNHAREYRAALERAGFTVRPTARADEAVRIAQQGSVGFVVVGEHVGAAAALELCRTFVPFPLRRLLLTPHPSTALAERYMRAGCPIWLAHPADADELADVVWQIASGTTDAPASAADAVFEPMHVRRRT